MRQRIPILTIPASAFTRIGTGMTQMTHVTQMFGKMGLKLANRPQQAWAIGSLHRWASTRWFAR